MLEQGRAAMMPRAWFSRSTPQTSSWPIGGQSRVRSAPMAMAAPQCLRSALIKAVIRVMVMTAAMRYDSKKVRCSEKESSRV